MRPVECMKRTHPDKTTYAETKQCLVHAAARPLVPSPGQAPLRPP